MPKQIAAPAKKKIPAKKNVLPAAKGVKSNLFPIVAIGASAGGLEAVKELFKYLPPDTGMAFIFIQHLSPDYKSILALLLAKATKMNVQEIENMDLIKPNNVYVIPNNKGIEVVDGHIQLSPRLKNPVNLSIDVLFTSLAETHKENAIGVVLSGNASDGTLGLKAIKEEGGITFAQDNSAKFNSMPESAISEGVADFILSPKEIALELGRICKYAFNGKKILKAGNENKVADNNPDLKIILQLLLKAKGVDFTHYKMNTIKRRILRRMLLYKIATLKQYIKLLKTKTNEINVLYNDVLINVTDFFREPEAFLYLKTFLLPKLLKTKSPKESIRIWVTACSTGQEVYSIAMLIMEVLGDKLSARQVQIFGSDLSEQAIKKARTGEYSKHEVKAVSPKRLERFFTLVNGNYRIAKSLRDLCSFAPHNIVSDPPFSRIDFISCCNLLIYFDTATQKKLLTTFSYALNDGGFLMLGKSETVGASPLFSPLNEKFKIYSRVKGTRNLPGLTWSPASVSDKKEERQRKDPLAALAAINSIIFSRYLPAYVVINHDLDILQFKGATFNYLEHTTGKATLNILNMARPDIAFDLRDTISKVIKTNHEIHKPGIEIKNASISHTISLDVIPVSIEGEEPLLLVIFTEQAAKQEDGPKSAKPLSAAKMSQLNRLKEELAVVKADLLIASEENERSNKILQTANEEILSSNEEFQSMNEELNSSKEEIESANEELITSNQELQTRNEQLAEANDFSEAIITTLHEPMLVLDDHLCIKSANKAFSKTFLVRESDIQGTLLFELVEHQWDIAGLRELLETSIKKDNYFYDYEITHVFPKIGKKTMLLNARRIVQKVNNEHLILLAFTDITESNQKRTAEKKELENIISERTGELEKSCKELEERTVALERMNKELETFTFISSHDLQEPLRKINDFSAILLAEEQKNLSITGKNYLQRILGSVNRMQGLIEDLLNYSQVKNTGPKFEKTDLNKTVEQVIADLKEAINEKNAIIKTGGLCKVSIIRFQFRQLVQNLVSNSLKFSDPARPLRISITCKATLAGKLNNKYLLPGINYCHLTFTDNGIGFSPKYNERIFEVFQRLNAYDEYKGTGMGLAICKRIVENHNGFITATGRLNKGARFDIYIPMT